MALATVLLVTMMASHVVSQMTQPRCNYNELTNSLTAYDFCLKNVMNVLFGSSPSTPGNSLQQTCGTAVNQQVDQCQLSLEQQLSLCVDGDQRVLLDVLKRANHEGVSYLCQDGGNRLKEFLRDRGAYCLYSTLPQQNACIMASPLLSMYIEKYEGGFCTNQQPQGLLCLKDAISKSSSCSLTSADFLVGYYQAMVAATPCKGAATAANTVLLLMLATLVGCYRRLY